MIGAVLGAVLGTAGLIIILRWVAGLLVLLVRHCRRRPARGDAAMCAALDQVRGRRSRRIAAALVEPAATDPIRIATVGCSAEGVFEVGSVSKAITGMLLADAEERGELRMDDPVEDILPELVGRPIGRVAVSALASHRSGLPRLGFGPRAVAPLLGHLVIGSNPYAGQGVSFVIRSAGRATLRGQGEVSYSNLGGALAGAVLERTTGSSYQELVQQRLAAPLGLTHTSARADASRLRGGTRWGQWVQAWRLTGYAPAGGVTSSVADLATLAEALLRGGAVGAQSLDRDDCFWVRERLTDDGMVVWHNGMTGGHAAYLGLRPERGRAIVVVSDVADMQLVTRAAQAIARAN